MAAVMELDRSRLKRIIQSVLKEDIGAGDITTAELIPELISVRACVIAKEEAVFCGMDIIEMALGILDQRVRFKPQVSDGDTVSPGREICLIEGPARSILACERTALNFIAHLSGIATATHRFVTLLNDSGIKIMDTRKTTPLLRYLEKYAVKTGGGVNHRFGLWDQVMVKDNHKAILQSRNLSFAKAMEKLQKNISSKMLVEIEADTFEEFREALTLKPHVILLDNMDMATIKKCVAHKNGKNQYKNIELEISGGITLDNIASYAGTGVDRISVGALTHSVKSIDFSLEIIV